MAANDGGYTYKIGNQTYLVFPNAQISCQCNHFDMIWDYKPIDEKVQAFKIK